MKKPDNKELLINAEKQGVPTTKGDRVLVWHDEFEDRNSISKNKFKNSACKFQKIGFSGHRCAPLTLPLTPTKSILT